MILVKNFTRNEIEIEQKILIKFVPEAEVKLVKKLLEIFSQANQFYDELLTAHRFIHCRGASLQKRHHYKIHYYVIITIKKIQFAQHFRARSKPLSLTILQ